MLALADQATEWHYSVGLRERVYGTGAAAIANLSPRGIVDYHLKYLIYLADGRQAARNQLLPMNED